MTSVLRFLKQRPSDSQYFISLSAVQGLNIFNQDANSSTQTYVSGAAAGNFTLSTVVARSSAVLDSSSNTTLLFRDMGVTIVSSMRTFRRVQLLTLDNGANTPAVGGGAANNGLGIPWSSQGTSTAGVFVQGGSTEGVTGSQVSAGSTADSSFGVFYFETGANGIGLAQGLIRYG
uniref:Uncharacterized protein n=1 Tax=viral metagenome TaxID=1070528 RepID=A0A6C0DF18_9ZZZZ